MAKLDAVLQSLNRGETTDGQVSAALMSLLTRQLEREGEEISNRQLAEAMARGFNQHIEQMRKIVRELDASEAVQGEAKSLQKSIDGLAQQLSQMQQAAEKRDSERQQAVSADLKRTIQAIESIEIPKPDLEPIVDALQALMDKEPPDLSQQVNKILERLDKPEKWVFEIEREAFSDKISQVTATKA